MSQITDHRRGRLIRRGIAIILVLVVAPAAYLTYTLTRDRRPAVRTSELATGDISSTMTITAMIRPGDVQETSISRQLVKEVLAQPGDQVRAGDPLVTFDLTEFHDNLKKAQDARQEAETAIEKMTDLASSQSNSTQKTLSDLQKQLSRLTAGLGGTTSALGGLVSQSTSALQLDETALANLTEQIIAIDTDSPDAPAQIRAILTQVNSSVSVNPDYQAQLDTLSKNISQMSSAASGLTSLIGDPNMLALLAGGSNLGSQVTSMASTAQSALAAAIQAEQQAQSALDNAVEVIYAEIDGIVAKLDAEPGEYTGTASAASSNSISSLLGGAASLPTVTGEPVVVIYDNTRPRAFFQANRFDAGRLAVGMPVTYAQDGRSWGGEITRKGSFASNVDLTGSGSSNLLGNMTSSVSGLTSEPMIDLEMSILGADLTSLTLGFTIEAEIETASATDVLLVPAEALKKELGEYFVFVLLPDGLLQKRTLVPGIQSALYAQVLSGLTAGEKVVLSPTNDLADGLEVREVN